jgi:hypothetical protein
MVQALELDLVGPSNDHPFARELLSQSPARWYLTGFLVPSQAPTEQKVDETATEEIDSGPDVEGADDAASPDRAAARRSILPSSMGLSVLVGPGVASLNAIISWGDYVYEGDAPLGPPASRGRLQESDQEEATNQTSRVSPPGGGAASRGRLQESDQEEATNQTSRVSPPNGGAASRGRPQEPDQIEATNQTDEVSESNTSSDSAGQIGVGRVDGEDARETRAVPGGVPAGWRRIPRSESVIIKLDKSRIRPIDFEVPNSGGLSLAVTIRQVAESALTSGRIPAGARSVSVFLVNNRRPDPNNEHSYRAFVFQAQLELKCEEGFTARPDLRAAGGVDGTELVGDGENRPPEGGGLGRADGEDLVGDGENRPRDAGGPRGPRGPRGGPRGDSIGEVDWDEMVADLQYRDTFEYAVGHGVSATAQDDNDGACRSVQTNWIPTAQVERVAPSSIPDVELGMEALGSLADAQEAASKLMPLVNHYREWIAGQKVVGQALKGQLASTAAELMTNAGHAAKRIEHGISLLSDPDVLEAFRIANRAMGRAARQREAIQRVAEPSSVPAPTWRPFQLAFILMTLQGLVDPLHGDRETVDLLFFPTGGGKTEAYLGLAAFSMVLRRLRNPGIGSAGISVLMRYTLRLLTLDQLGRAAALICALELERKQNIRLGEWPFEIGLWVGSAATPNRMGRRGDTGPGKEHTAYTKTMHYQSDDRQPAPIPLESCPWCGKKFARSSFRLVPNIEKPENLLVRCANYRCPFSGDESLPIVGVDEPLYRRLPAFVIATVDKFAALPWTGQTGALFGLVDRYDKKGFYGPAEPGVGRPLPGGETNLAGSGGESLGDAAGSEQVTGQAGLVGVEGNRPRDAAGSERVTGQAGLAGAGGNRPRDAAGSEQVAGQADLVGAGGHRPRDAAGSEQVAGQADLVGAGGYRPRDAGGPRGGPRGGPWLPPPDLIIQDELHLISGPLGTIAGVYETAIDALCARKADGKTIKPKIIASTATVRKADAQIRALFERTQVNIFPPPGPDRRDSFFALTISPEQSPARLYVGVTAQGRSLKVVLLRAGLALLSAAQTAYNREGGKRNKQNPADPYMTMLGYFNSLRELGGSRRIVEDEIRTRLEKYSTRQRIEPPDALFADRAISYDVVELTSRVSTGAVSEAKERLTHQFHEGDHVDVALATNMISVGLDIVRLGLMVVLGQPKTSAEYIQATSRVGRDGQRPGLIVTLLNVHKPRDRSHYERFETYHSSFYRAVEATSVTPFAPRALDRALAAALVGLCREGDAEMTPPLGAGAILSHRTALQQFALRFAERAGNHAALSDPEQAERLRQNVLARCTSLLDDWFKIADQYQQTNTRLQYQHEAGDAQRLLRDFLDPELLVLPPVHWRFRAGRSMRDVEPGVDLEIKNLNEWSD